MKILLIGSGGREHALAWKIAQSPRLTKLYIASGNAGTCQNGENVPLNISNFDEIKDFVLKNQIEMVVVGPEAPLAAGLGDYFASTSDLQHLAFIGPQKNGALLESSKNFAKAFMQRYNIPTAAYQSFTTDSLEEGRRFLRTLSPPYVLKADGLAAGKGVVIVSDLQEAETELVSMLGGKFGAAGNKVVIEEFLTGIELSVFVLTDGQHWVLLPEAKDYKRIGEGDTGPNTGGMGSVSPVPFASQNFMDKVKNQIIEPTIYGLQQEKIPYKGFIFFGLMNVNGNPFVIEYNVRMGDPETESVMPRIESDFVELLQATAQGTLDKATIKINPDVAVSVMLVSGGYPDDYQKGKEITGIENDGDALLFHAGTSFNEQGKTITAGGRVIAVTALAPTLKQAMEKCYERAGKIHFEGVYFRRDIGKDLSSIEK
jgi:phosphoribosylamine--glycine ligase